MKHKSACPRAPVAMVMYGDSDKTKEILLCDDPASTLQSGCTHEFDVSFLSVTF